MHTNILIIEDNLADITLIEAYLKTAAFRHTLYTSDSLHEGLIILKESAIDLVLLDLKLVDMEGFQTLRIFREKAPDVPVIVLTGFRNEIMGIQSVRAGAQDFLVKGDFDAKSLVRSIRYALQRFETQAKLQEKAKELSQSERRNQLALQIARFGKWEMDVVNNAMTWDDEIYQFFGFFPQSFTPTLSDYLKYVQVDDRGKVERFFEEALKDGQPHSIAHRIVIDNTTVKHLQVKAQANYDKSTNRILLVGVVQDITGSSPLQIPPPAANSTSIGSSIELSKSLFTEFDLNLRAPLGTISGFLALLEKTKLDSQQQNLIDGLKNSLGELSFTLNNWFYTWVIKQGEITIDPASAAITDIIKLIEKAIQNRSEETGVKVFFELADNIPPIVLTDRDKLTQIVYNLLEIAIRNSPQGDKVSARFQLEQLGPSEWHLQFSTFFTNLSLSPEEARQMLEQALESFDASNDKPCCLLSVVAIKLAQAMGGSLEIMPAIGGLTEMRYEQKLATPIEADTPLPDSPQMPLQILLVDDHNLQRMSLDRMLRAWSNLVSVDLAENGKQAVEKSRQKDYSVILLDLHMPGMDGFETAIKIREKSVVSIIALSINESAEERERCSTIGINSYITKPIQPKLLFSSIIKQMYAPAL
jgi:DNA-binding response OmpR family regulator